MKSLLILLLPLLSWGNTFEFESEKIDSTTRKSCEEAYRLDGDLAFWADFVCNISGAPHVMIDTFADAVDACKNHEGVSIYYPPNCIIKNGMFY